MDERDDFIASMKRRHSEAERALLNGEPELYLAMWSTRDPVTAMGATGRDVTTSGWDGVSQALKLVASRNSDCTDYVFDVIAADVLGDAFGASPANHGMTCRRAASRGRYW